ncbi:protein FAM46A [Platysternon megacephalum]|uniref:Protein FAM46A n=1 Tax=Platysternon megacephalum TaxID=55544 RepID=A0A4D9F058_9SAUR|nr:protein FAM46A [Platysternon megacephalum]
MQALPKSYGWRVCFRVQFDGLLAAQLCSRAHMGALQNPVHSDLLPAGRANPLAWRLRGKSAPRRIAARSSTAAESLHVLTPGSAQRSSQESQLHDLKSHYWQWEHLLIIRMAHAGTWAPGAAAPSMAG